MAAYAKAKVCTRLPCQGQSVHTAAHAKPKVCTWLAHAKAKVCTRLPMPRPKCAHGQGRNLRTRLKTSSEFPAIFCRVDRGSKATLPLTIPRRVFKSSAKDSTRLGGITFQGGPCGSSAARASPTARASGDREVPTAGRQTGGGRTRRSSPDSDLEAFSHNPAHGSFAPLAFQPSAMTNCANQRFLSY
ncbi:hypothetical protein LWI29_008649 [Acer saccharum]|uniref:Uncharacterized protein n=1 Tax=Acer saccharum TaxID=4024 RepID=A0AA39SMF8_ACESA|nr:hypothetical protein LWI29_008649 [Acer saccharum]